MANQEHLDILKQGVEMWNKWRKEHLEIQPDLSEADLTGTKLRGVDLSRAELTGTNFSEADLREAYLCYTNSVGASFKEADLSEADLSGAYLFGAILWKTQLFSANLRDVDLRAASLVEADLAQSYMINANLGAAYLENSNLNHTCLDYANLTEAYLSGAHLFRAGLYAANLTRADLSEADLSEADLRGADLSEANLIGANLSEAILIGTSLRKANLTSCRVYGVSAWDVQMEGTRQENLIITPNNSQFTITVDNLEVSQFIYLLLDNQKIRDVIDTITSKVVLILGRFTPTRKVVLDALRDELRKKNYLPVVFDFEKPVSRDLTETVSTLAHLARFIIVDLTDPSSAPHEVATIIPHCVVPVQPLLTLQPLIIEGKTVERREYAMFQDLRRRHPWVLPTFRYRDTADLLASLQEHIIEPAERKAKELAKL